MGDKEYAICRTCNEYLLNGLYDFEKERILRSALELSEKDNILIPYAINVVRGKYSCREAKRRTRLKKMENSGKSTDIYSMGRRSPGSFRSKR